MSVCCGFFTWWKVLVVVALQSYTFVCRVKSASSTWHRNVYFRCKDTKKKCHMTMFVMNEWIEKWYILFKVFILHRGHQRRHLHRFSWGQTNKMMKNAWSFSVHTADEHSFSSSFKPWPCFLYRGAQNPAPYPPWCAGSSAILKSAE